LTVFPICYFPPIPWFAALIREEKVFLEVTQHYRKQHFTNRMRVRIANRVMPLVVPLQRSGSSTPIREKRIANDENWQRVHWLTLESGYRSSPYFEFYEDRFRPFFEKPYSFIADLNEGVLEVLFDILSLSPELTLTTEFLDSTYYEKDYRQAFHASGKLLPPSFHVIPYTQVFDGFEAGLSIFDLICNEGPSSRKLLLDSWRPEN
jgi:hypothetical protein